MGKSDFGCAQNNPISVSTLTRVDLAALTPTLLRTMCCRFAVCTHRSPVFLVWPLGVHPGCPDDCCSMQEEAKILLLQTCFITASCLLLPLGITISSSMHTPLLSTRKTPTSISFLISQKSGVESNMICALPMVTFVSGAFYGTVQCLSYIQIATRPNTISVHWNK